MRYLQKGGYIRLVDEHTAARLLTEGFVACDAAPAGQPLPDPPKAKGKQSKKTATSKEQQPPKGGQEPPKAEAPADPGAAQED